ncbi:MAG: glycosyltransferase family 4 protein [candidate division Zixibacteria bacterium]|nr:glycosyltransferase family 4 protein [candidate division Zixibacteria bacterium]
MVSARWHRRPVAVVVGGYEVAWVPEIEYGIPPRSLRERTVRAILSTADLLLPVSEHTLYEMRTRFPQVNQRTQRIYNGVDTASFQTDPSAVRGGVLCVGTINRETVNKKGWQLFWNTAALLPHVPFIAVGRAPDAVGGGMIARRPPNLTWLGELTGESLRRQFQTARVYFQGSAHESFGVALAEAMACGCIPVVSRRGALPEVAGEAAFYIDALTAESAQAAVREALLAPESRRLAARQRIVENFDIGRRRTELTDALHEMLQSARR